MDELRLVASYDDLIQLCSTDTNLAHRYKSVMEQRDVTFDPYISCASNPELLNNSKIYTKNNKISKRMLHTFNADLYTSFFIKQKLLCIEQQNNNNIKRDGFDAYAYLMAYEDEILNVYKTNTKLTKLQKAALYFIETGSEEKELNYYRYVATYDDVAKLCSHITIENLAKLCSHITTENLDYFVNEVSLIGKTHYHTHGKAEINNGSRDVIDFFDHDLYIASHPHTYNEFKNSDGSINENLAIYMWIKFGSTYNIPKNSFSPMMYIANNPQVCSDDVYKNKKLNSKKIIKHWLEHQNDPTVNMNTFDVEDYIETNELNSDVNPYEEFALRKADEFQKQLKINKSFFKKMIQKIPKLNNSCIIPSIKKV